ncbi:MFS transporter [Gluconacetobacter sacchari]|uniref:MFS transporter n=2 Tax=Gluconacetobacter sacchari TaxID=92759 RepID=A0A7W4IGM3_9PROT|nr:MFS transporter [Gluconacetobacter sacchari]MBB2162442.1 hypothetical protein [Gluconacetobacter sacchari]
MIERAGPVERGMSLEQRKNERILLTSTIVSCIGSGASSILIGKLLYELTGSVGAFGTLIFVDFVLAMVVNLVGGGWIDRANAKAILCGNELARGCVLLIIGWLLWLNVKYWMLVMLLLYTLRVGQHLSKLSMFSLLPRCIPPSSLASFTARNSGAMQGALLVGATFVGFALVGMSYAPVIVFDALTFFVSAFLLARLTGIDVKPRLPRVAFRSIIEDWMRFRREFFRDPRLAVFLVLAAEVPICVALSNLWLAPLVFVRFNDNPIYLSVFEGSFSVGAITVFFFRNYLGRDEAGYVFMLLQAISIILLGFCWSPAFAILGFVALGVGLASSNVYFSVRLQSWNHKGDYGKIMGYSSVMNLAVALAILPVFSFVTDQSLGVSIVMFGVLVLSVTAMLFLKGGTNGKGTITT